MIKEIAKKITPPLSSPYLRGGWVGLISIVVLLFFISVALAEKSEKWPGVDESVVEKYAKEHGREAREPFINTDQATCFSLSSCLQARLAVLQQDTTGRS